MKKECETCEFSKNSNSTNENVNVMIVTSGNNEEINANIISTFYKLTLNLIPKYKYFLTSAVKCQTEAEPTKLSIEKCNHILKAELNKVKPKYVLIVGKGAFKALLWNLSLKQTRKIDILKLEGTYIEEENIVYIPIEYTTDTLELIRKIHRFVEISTESEILPIKAYKEVEEKDLDYIKETAIKTGVISVDIETNCLSPFMPTSEIISTAISVKEGEAFWFPMSIKSGQYFKKWDFSPKLSVNKSLEFLNSILIHDKVKKKYFNMAFDVMWQEVLQGIIVLNMDDVMVRKYLMNQGDKERNNLKYLSKKYTKIGYYEHAIAQYINSEENNDKHFDNIPPEKMLVYNCADADATLQLENIFEPQCKKLGIDVFYQNFIIPRLRGIIDLQKDGMAVDFKLCKELIKEYTDKINSLKYELKSIPQIIQYERETKKEFNPASTKQIFSVVFKERKEGSDGANFNIEAIKIARKNNKSKKYEKTLSFGEEAIKSFLKENINNNDYLEHINTFDLNALPSHIEGIDDIFLKFTKIVATIKTISTQLSNHISPFSSMWGNSIDGLVHTSYDITGTTTGRLNSRNPNLLNLSREGFVKKVLISRWKDNGVLIEGDFKQLEIYVLAILSKDERLCSYLLKGEDIHKKTAAEVVFKVPEAQITKKMRTDAKKVVFGIIYGKTEYSLAKDLNVSINDARDILSNYFKEFSGIKRYMDVTKSIAHSKGYITTIMGRKRYLDYQTDYQGADRKAINTSIQSPAADICLTAISMEQEFCKKLAIKYNEKVAVVCNSVYDSITTDTKTEHLEEVIKAKKYIMENVPLKWIDIPLKIDIKYGKNLLEMKEFQTK